MPRAARKRIGPWLPKETSRLAAAGMIKIDVEGAEAAMIQSLRPALPQLASPIG